MNNPQNMAVMTGAQAQTVQGEKIFDDLKSHSGSTVNFDAGSLSLNNPSAVFAEGVHGLVPAPAAGDIAAGRVLGAGGTWVTRDGAATPYINTSSAAPAELSNQIPSLMPIGGVSRHEQGGMTADAERITVPASGVYLISALVNFAASGTGQRGAAIVLNNHGVRPVNVIQWNAGANSPTIINLSTIIDLTAGDYLRIVAVQGSGGPLYAMVEGFRVIFLSTY